MRSITVPIPAAPIAQERFTTKYVVKVITPLFGGGVATRKIDESNPIRVPSIRGHLRWWYRATLGRKYKTVNELRESELEIFGDTSRISKLDVHVRVTKPGRPLNRDEVPLQAGDRLFPLFQQDYGNVRTGIEFELELGFPKELKSTIETVLWAWSNFGGIGAKTRRGCGALWISEFRPRAYKDHSGLALQNWSVRIGRIENSEPWPQLNDIPLVRPGQSNQSPVQAWRACIEAYRLFRQAGPAERGLASFDLLGYAKGSTRMSSAFILRPAAWQEGALAMPMMIPLRAGSSETQAAVRKVAEFLFRQQGFRPIGEY